MVTGNVTRTMLTISLSVEGTQGRNSMLGVGAEAAPRGIYYGRVRDSCPVGGWLDPVIPPGKLYARSRLD